VNKNEIVLTLSLPNKLNIELKAIDEERLAKNFHLLFNLKWGNGADRTVIAIYSFFTILAIDIESRFL
jgi:hypothetical protein